MSKEFYLSSEQLGLPVEKRTKIVGSIREKNIRDLIRVQFVREKLPSQNGWHAEKSKNKHSKDEEQQFATKISQMWGIIWINELPFCFRAYRGFEERQLEVLKNGVETVRTKWWPHNPYFPLDFFPPVGTDPISIDEKECMLLGLGVDKKNIVEAMENDSLNRLYKETLFSKKGDYSKAKELLNNDSAARNVFDAVICTACDLEEHQLLNIVG